MAAVLCVAAFCVACSDGVEVATRSDEGLPPFCDDVEPIRGTVEGRQGVEDDELVVVADGYASSQATYGGAWYDRALGTFVVAFTDDPEPHRAAIEQRLGDHDGTFDVVQVEILADDDARRELAEMLPVDAICVRGPAEPPAAVDRDSVVLIVDDEADPLVQCRSMPFRLSALDQPAGFEGTDHPVAEALRTMLGPDTQPYLLNATGWRLLAEEGAQALVAAGTPISEMVGLELLGDVWVFAGSWGGPCEPRLLVPDGVWELDWWLDTDFPSPGPDDTLVHVRVDYSGCGSLESHLERVIGPRVRITESEVRIAFAQVAPPRRPPCGLGPGTAGHPMVVELDEPLGDRVVVDALDVPPRRPVTEREW